MNKFKSITLSISALAMLSYPLIAATPLTEDEVSKIASDYPKLFDQPNISLIRGMNHGDFNEIEVEAVTQQGKQVFSVYTSEKIENAVFFGKAFDKDQVPYEIPADKSVVEKGIALTMGTGEKQLYLITDPECPYCQKLDNNIKPEALKEYTINVIPYPLPFHKNAKPMMYWVLDGADNNEKVERLRMVMNNDKTFESFKPSPERKAELDIILDNAMKAVKDLKVSGTPTILDDNLKPVHFSVIGDIR